MPLDPSPLAPDDFYTEGEALVFTAAYHLKRGYCCGSGCRHCPWQATDLDKPQENEYGPGNMNSKAGLGAPKP